MLGSIKERSLREEEVRVGLKVIYKAKFMGYITKIITDKDYIEFEGEVVDISDLSIMVVEYNFFETTNFGMKLVKKEMRLVDTDWDFRLIDKSFDVLILKGFEGDLATLVDSSQIIEDESLLRLELEQTKRLLASCEFALGERDRTLYTTKEVSSLIHSYRLDNIINDLSGLPETNKWLLNKLKK